jgi:low temperature requirement protein LtrA
MSMRVREPVSGWLVFAGTILGIAGIMRIFDAIWAFRYDHQIQDGLNGAVLGTNLNTYGWVYLIVGIILIAASFAVLARSQLARWFGIVAAAIAGISAMWWMPFYPVWSLTYVLLAGLVIYALAAYGGRTAEV